MFYNSFIKTIHYCPVKHFRNHYNLLKYNTLYSLFSFNDLNLYIQLHLVFGK